MYYNFIFISLSIPRSSVKISVNQLIKSKRPKGKLETRLDEHKTDKNCALHRHSCLTNHEINYSNPSILTKDGNYFRLQIKETFKI